MYILYLPYMDTRDGAHSPVTDPLYVVSWKRRCPSHLDLVPPPAYFGHAYTQYSECPLVVVVHPLGPLLGPKMLILHNNSSRRS